MSRFTFWIVNLTGVYLILTREDPDPMQPRVLIGGGLVLLGTFGILAMHLWGRVKRKDEQE